MFGLHPQLRFKGKQRGLSPFGSHGTLSPSEQQAASERGLSPFRSHGGLSPSQISEAWFDVSS
jgi:hypothetical protein